MPSIGYIPSIGDFMKTAQTQQSKMFQQPPPTVNKAPAPSTMAQSSQPKGIGGLFSRLGNMQIDMAKKVAGSMYSKDPAKAASIQKGLEDSRAGVLRGFSQPANAIQNEIADSQAAKNALATLQKADPSFATMKPSDFTRADRPSLILAAEQLKRQDPSLGPPGDVMSKSLASSVMYAAEKQGLPTGRGTPMQGPGFPADAVNPNANPFSPGALAMTPSMMPGGMAPGMTVDASAYQDASFMEELKKEENRKYLYLAGGVAALALVGGIVYMVRK